MKRRTVFIAGIVCAAALLSAALPLARILIWNATASVPTGLYHIRGKAGLQVGERVAIDPPPRLRDYLATRGYLPTGIPLLKDCLLYTSPSPRDRQKSRMPSSA